MKGERVSGGMNAKRGQRRGPRPGAIPEEVLGLALRQAAYLRRRNNVLGLSIGMRHRRGAWVPREDCISIRVVQKLGEHELDARHLLPRFITVKLGRRSWKVPTDVRTAGGLSVGQCFGHVAAQLTGQDSALVVGGVSACVLTTTVPKFLISGHVAEGPGRRLVANGIELITEDPVMTNRLDHCLATADFNLTDASLPDNVRFRGIRDSASIRRGDSLFVGRAIDNQTHQVVVRNTQADTVFRYPTGNKKMVELLAVDAVCQKGDSGCPLFDEDFNLVGTLLGGAGEDYYLPIDRAFDELTIDLPR